MRLERLLSENGMVFGGLMTRSRDNQVLRSIIFADSAHFGASVKLKTKISRDLVIKPPQTIPFSDSNLRDASHWLGLEK